jgi:hypothetical protein
MVLDFYARRNLYIYSFDKYIQIQNYCFNESLLLLNYLPFTK